MAEAVLANVNWPQEKAPVGANVGTEEGAGVGAVGRAVGTAEGAPGGVVGPGVGKDDGSGEGSAVVGI